MQTRRNLVMLFALGALFSALAFGAVLMQRQTALRGTLDGIPDAGLPPRVPIMGVNVELTQYDSTALAENLDLIAETGFAWVRQPFSWAEMEPQPGAYDWSVYDPVVEAAAARGLRLVAVLVDSPSWAAPDPTAPPDDLDAFTGFAAALAGRYGDRVAVYQVWDEPNLAAGWGGEPASPVAYAALLQAAYTAIHEADGDALVLTAGLAPTIETGPDNLSDVLFLRSLYDAGAAPYFDGAAGKPYGFDTGPDDRRIDHNLLNFSRFILLREEMERHGDGHKPLWASHFGWNSLPDDWGGSQSLWGYVTPGAQAEQTIAAYERALMEWPWAGALILENWQPDAPPDDPRWGFALRDADGTLSPTAEALRVRPEFTGALYPGVYPATTPLVAYSGEWEFSELGADIGQQGDSAIDFPFVGDSLAVTVRRDHYRAYLYVEVDEQPSEALPRDERGAYLVLTSPDYKPAVETLTIADGLAPGQIHHGHIEAERGWDQWALIGFAVGHHVRTLGYDASLAMLAAIALALIVLSARAARGLEWPRLADLLRGASSRLGEGLHFALGLAAALAVWLGAALTWGGLIPNLVRRLGDGPSLLITVLTAGVFYYSPWLILTLVALAALFLLIYTRLEIGPALIMFFTPFFLIPRPLFDRAFSMVEVTSLLTLLAWAIQTVAARREAGWPSPGEIWRRMTGPDKAVTAFVVLSVVSLSWADLVGVAVTELRQVIIEPAVVYLVLRTTPLTRRARWRVVDMLIAAGVIVSAVGLYQYVTGTDVITAEAGIRRLKSLFYGSPNGTALYLGRLIPIAAAVLLVGGDKLRRWLYGAVGVLMTGAMLLTLSKGGLLLALPAGLGLVVILWAGRTGLIVVGVGALLEILGLIPLTRHPRFADLLDFTSGTSTSFFRLQLWRSTLQMIRDHPITGVGLDQFLYQYRGRYILPAAWQEPDLSMPHNFLLNYWVRLGILGLGIGVWLQVAFWRLASGVHRRLRDGGDTASRALVVGLMGSMAAFIAHGLVDEVHFMIDLACVFFMTLGLMHQIGEEVGTDGSHDQQSNAAVG